jgi:hypothetical protein
MEANNSFYLNERLPMGTHQCFQQQSQSFGLHAAAFV